MELLIAVALVANVGLGVLVGFMTQRSGWHRPIACASAVFAVFGCLCCFIIGYEMLFGRGFIAGVAGSALASISFAIISLPAAPICCMTQAACAGYCE